MIKTYEVPTMTAPNFNRPGGLMTVQTLRDGNNVRVVQRMPNPSSTNLPFVTISDATMPQALFTQHVEPTLIRLGARLLK
jgi:hypothetical protein